MSTYTQILYQVVFSPKDRAPVLIKANRERLFSYLGGVINKHKSIPIRINGVEDHLHIIMYLHPSTALADLIKDMKIASSIMIKENNLFPGFKGWQAGYSAFTYAAEALDNLTRYVERQEEHHKRKTFREEIVQLLSEHKVEYDERYLP